MSFYSLIKNRIDINNVQKGVDRLKINDIYRGIVNPSPTGKRTSDLAISEKLKSQEVGLSQGEENAENAVNLLNTAEGALESVQDSLQRVRELAISARSGILTDSDRSVIQGEIDDILEGVSDNLINTEFNTIRVLDEGFDGNIQTSSSQGRTMNIENTSLETLGLDNFDVTGDFNLEDIDNAIEQVSDSRASIGAQTNALRSNINSSQIARENTLAARSNLDEDFVQSINNLRKENLLNQYRINVQRLQQENEGSELSLLR